MRIGRRRPTADGRTDEVLLDGRPLQRGAPPPYQTIRRRIDRRRRRLQRSEDDAIRPT